MSTSTARCSAWSVTINNPNDSDEECINLARQQGWKVHGQKEVGAEGTPHYQLMLKTPQVRFSAVKKMFPRAHIEPCRDPIALAKYVTKEDTRVGELLEDNAMYPSLSKLWTLMLDYLIDQGHYAVRTFKGGVQEVIACTPCWSLTTFDSFICDAIDNGYRVETMGVNPQIRSAWKNYGSSIIFREVSARNSNLAHNQTDRQTQENIVLPTTTNAPEVQTPRSEDEEDESSSCGSEDGSSEEFSESEYQEV